MTTLKLSLDNRHFDAMLSALSDAGERFPEFAEALLDLVEAGDEIFLLDSDGASTTGADELVMRLYPADALVRLVTAFRARHSNLGLFQHFPLPIDAADSSTTSEAAQ